MNQRGRLDGQVAFVTAGGGGIGRAMRKKTIAECTESDAIRQRLIDLGVDCAQGFAIDHPVEIERYFGTSQRMSALA